MINILYKTFILAFIFLLSGHAIAQQNFNIYFQNKSTNQNIYINGPATNNIISAYDANCKEFTPGFRSGAQFRFGPTAKSIGTAGYAISLTNKNNCAFPRDNIVEILIYDDYNGQDLGSCHRSPPSPDFKYVLWFNTVGVNTCIYWRYPNGDDIKYKFNADKGTDSDGTPSISLVFQQ